MKILLEGKEEDPHRFGGSTPLVAELDDATIDGHGLREPLERFGQDLARQMATRYSQPASGEVIGVDIHRIEFTLVIKPNIARR